VNGVAALPKDWINKTRLGSVAAAFAVKISANAATVATISRNCARRNFPTSHNRNLLGNDNFNATPVAALAGGALDTLRRAAKA
jgi:hypothetical protein